MDKRGFNYQEALVYLGIKRRAFEKHIRPYIAATRMGTSVVFDRVDLDRILDEHKGGNGRPLEKGGTTWADRKTASIVTSKATGGSTKFIEVLDFASVSAKIRKKPKTG